MNKIQRIKKALSWNSLNADERAIGNILNVAKALDKKGGDYSLKDSAKIESDLDKKYPPKHRQYEYAIIPVTFKDYSEYVDVLNDYGKDGWVFGALIRTYEDSPEKGLTTHDYVCCKPL